MIARRPEQGWRAMAFAAALFAITLNFLQPLAHAAMMRDGMPSTLWTVFCNSTAGDTDGTSGKAPMDATQHDCCLGLAQVPAIAPPPVLFVALEPVATVIPALPATESVTSTGIRDGPTRPRGPPSFV
jgi:Protein of unknown function (DUF2946)